MSAGGRLCALPVRFVDEVMRPLPIEPVGDMPAYVAGVSVIRGVPTPVVDLGALLDNRPTTGTFGRLVTVKLGERQAALGVDDAIGLRQLDPATVDRVPPVLGDTASNVIEGLAVHDRQLTVVLRAMMLIPDRVWSSVDAHGDGPR